MENLIELVDRILKNNDSLAVSIIDTELDGECIPYVDGTEPESEMLRRTR